MLGFLGTLLAWVLGLFVKKSPKIEEVAASNATNQAELTQEEASNAIISKGAVAGADADARIVRDLTKPSTTDAGTNVQLKRDFPSDFRD